MVRIIRNIFAITTLIMATFGCSKIDPNGFLIAPSHTEDRYLQSKYYFESNKPEHSSTAPGEFVLFVNKDEPYRYLLGADFHMKRDTTRMNTFLQLTRRKDLDDVGRYYRFASILGDIAETQPEYYAKASAMIERAVNDSIGLIDTTIYLKDFPLYAVVGNHDITHNGWAYFVDVFGTSTYTVWVVGIDVETEEMAWIDCHAFLDSANGTMGKGQLKEFLPENISMLRNIFRNVFVYTHNPFFRHRYDAVASNFPRDELYWLMNFFAENRVNYVFSGHIHVHGENSFRDVHYITLNAFSEEHTPKHAELCEVAVSGEGNGNIALKWLFFDE